VSLGLRKGLREWSVEIWVPWKVSPCAYESLSTKGEDFYPHTLLYDSNFTLT
jgi:hypothetical protein